MGDCNLMARLMARLVVLVCMACALMADAEQVDVEAGKLIDLGAGKHDLADLVNHMSHASPGTASGKPIIVPGTEPPGTVPGTEPIVGEEQLKTLRTTKYPVASGKIKCASFSVARRRRTYGWVSRRRGTHGGSTYSDLGYPPGKNRDGTWENVKREAIYKNQRRRYCDLRHYDNRRTCPEGSSPILKKLACEDAYRVQGPADAITRTSNQTTSNTNVYMGKGCIMYKWRLYLRRRGTSNKAYWTKGESPRKCTSAYTEGVNCGIKSRRRYQEMSTLYMNTAPQPTLKSAYTSANAQMVCEDNALPTAAPTPTAPPIGPK